MKRMAGANWWWRIIVPLCGLSAVGAARAQDPTGAAVAGWPYVYTNWEQFTVADGLLNDHIFAVRAAGAQVWVGTENGLACYDKRTRKFKVWTEKDGLPWRVVSAIEVNPDTGDVWVGMFGGGLARFSAGRFDHFNQMNSGLVNDVVYGLALEHDNVWAATTAGASCYDAVKGKWTIFTEKNAPMEEIWNYGACYNDGMVYLAVWGSGVLEYNVSTEQWKDYLDPDGEMEIDLYRDDGIVHVITTGVGYVDKVLWVSTYFGCSRYDGRHWRGYYDHDSGLPSNFNNNLKARSGQEAWFCSDKGLGACMDADTDTWVTYTSDGKHHRGQAVIKRDATVLKTVETGYNVPHNFIICADTDGDDVWVGTAKGLGHGMGTGYYPRLQGPPAVAPAVPPALVAAPAAAPVPLTLATTLEKINVGPYEKPGLPLKTNANYAHSAADIEPFGGVKPYKEHFLQQMEYPGPGRAIPEPADVQTVKIGFLGPILPTVSVATGGRSHEEVLGTAMLRGAQLAVEQANTSGGYAQRQLPFELIVRNDNGLWGASGNEVIRMAYQDQVWAILGTVDGANTHIAIRVALKAELPMLASGDTDPTYIETNIPWVFRCIGDDRQMNYIILDYLYRKMKYERAAIIRSSNRYGRFGVRKLRDGSRRLGHPIAVEMAYRVGATNFDLQLARVEEAKPQSCIGATAKTAPACSMPCAPGACHSPLSLVTAVCPRSFSASPAPMPRASSAVFLGTQRGRTRSSKHSGRPSANASRPNPRPTRPMRMTA